MHYLLLAVLFVTIEANAGNDFNSFSSLTDLLHTIRDPVFSSKLRIEALEISRKKMVQEIIKETGVQSKNELNLSFVKNPAQSALMFKEPWYDVQTEFYSTIHKESFYQRWVELQKLVHFTEYGIGLYQSMMSHWGYYSPVNEGRFYARWSKISIKSGQRTRQFNLPFFLMSEDINDLIRLENHEPYSDLLGSEELKIFLNKTSPLTNIKRQELAEKTVLNHRIYLRTLANAAKTIGSLNYLTGVSSRKVTEDKIRIFIDKFCMDCSPKEKNEYRIAALNYIERQKKLIQLYTPSSLVTNFCRGLLANNYHWNVNKFKPTPLEILTDHTALVNYYVVHKLKEKNREAIAKTILSQDLGILFLTNSINILDKNNEPVGTRLYCNPKNVKADNMLILSAIEEAQKNVEGYITRVNKKLLSSKFNLQQTNSTLEYFVQTNQAASIEAASSFPQGIGWILKSIAELDQDISLRKKTDAFVSWGGAIVGIGLTITGVGAPEGVAILISSIGVVKGLATGTYFYMRSDYEKEFSNEIRLAKHGSGIVNEENLKYHFNNYKKLKMTYIKDFGASAASFITIHRFALQTTGGDVAKSHTILGKAIEAFKTQRNKSFEQIQSLISQLAKN
jgi:hypothetical protein